MAALLKKGIGELPERERQVLALYHFQEMTMKETGAALGIGESRVSQIHTAVLSRLRIRLRDMLDRKAAFADGGAATAAVRPREVKRRPALAAAAHA